MVGSAIISVFFFLDILFRGLSYLVGIEDQDGSLPLPMCKAVDSTGRRPPQGMISIRSDLDWVLGLLILINRFYK
jgi:hypothetical protein